MRLKEDTRSSIFRRRDKEEVSNSVPNLAEDNNQEDRRSLIGSISKAVAKARSRRNSVGELSSPPSSPTAKSPSSPTAKSPTQPTSPAAEPTRASAPPPPPPSSRSKDNQISNEVKFQGGTTRRGNLFQWLKEGVGSRNSDDPLTTTKKRSEGSNNQTNVVSAPRYTRIYEEMNRLTDDFRQATVDNPLP